MIMLYVSTLFDPQRDSRPFYTVIYDSITKLIKTFPLYLPKTGKTYYDIDLNLKAVAAIIHGNEVCLNDYKQHLIGFDLDTLQILRAHDYPFQVEFTLDQGKLNQLLVKQIKEMQVIGLAPWTYVRGNVAPVYRYLQERGVYFGYEKVYPMWHMDTYSGRTRNTGFIIQGLEDDAPVNNTDNSDMFLNFDWVSADLRMASILSGDEKLVHAFKVNDPYTYMADTVNDGIVDNKFTRDESKISIFQSLYSMDYESPAMEFYSGLGNWMKQCKETLEQTGQISSVLGRIFRVGGERTIKSAFNAAIQGSVAQGMQRCLRTIWEMYPRNILTESHDSLVLTYRRGDQVASMIKDVADVMCHPFRSILDADPVFPVVVSRGSRYKLWDRLKRYD